MKIKNTSGRDLILPWLGDRIVLAGQVIEVPDEVAGQFDFPEPTWKLSKAKEPEHVFANPDPLDVSSQGPNFPVED